MASKKFNTKDLNDTHGPMNSVSKDDALAYVGVKGVKHLSKLDAELKREVLAKKRKLVNSTKKQDRRDSKRIIKNI
jgi:hypothetical protein